MQKVSDLDKYYLASADQTTGAPSSASPTVQCCSKINATSLILPDEGAVFTLDPDRTVYNRPVYKDDKGKFGFWHDGETGADADWVFGRLSNINITNFGRYVSYGYMVSDEDTQCPDQVQTWKELDNNQWEIRQSKVKCITELGQKNNAVSNIVATGILAFFTIFI